MKNNAIFELVNRRKCHTQLIHRQFELLKLMIDQNLLQEADLELLFEQVQKNGNLPQSF